MKSYLFVLIIAIAPWLHAQDATILTFDTALELALENSPEIIAARRNLERQRELLNAQQSSLKSQFNLSLEPFAFSRQTNFEELTAAFNESETRRSGAVFSVSQPILLTDATVSLQNTFYWRDSRSEFAGFRRNEVFNNDLTLTVIQPLFTYNRQKLALQDVENDLESAYLSYIIQGLRLETGLAQSFYRTYQNRMRLQVAREELENSRSSVEIIRNKVNAGLVAEEELLQAELNLLSSESTLQNAQVTLQNSLDDLKVLLGMELNEELRVVSAIDQDTVSLNQERAVELGLANRLELQQRKLDIINTQAGLTRAMATNEFRGNLSLQYGLTGNDPKAPQVFQDQNESQDVSISFEIPIFDWGERESRIKASEISVQEAQRNLGEERKNIVADIRRAYRTLKNQALQMQLAEQNLLIAQKTYDINLERYKNGDLTSMDLNLFQTQLSEKKNGLIDAQISYRLSLLDLKVQTLWDFEKDRPVEFEGRSLPDGNENEGELE